MPEVLSVEQAVDYWDRRHRTKGDLASGGDIGTDDATNEMFYAVRLGRLLEIMGDRAEPRAPMRVLDAGCGKGYFTRAMASFGHRVDGIDVSEHAIGACQEMARGYDSYAVSPLDAWAPPYLYDVVFSVDVLFHIMDDDVWECSVRNLAALVRWGGLLVMADHERDSDHIWSNYQRTRAAGRYRDLVVPLGFRVDPFLPYRFRHTPVGFHVFTRVA